MKRTVRNITKQIAIFSLVAILGLLVFNRIFYVHSHVSRDGRIVTHSHPFSKSEENSSTTQHQHSSFELSVLESLEFFLFGFLPITVGSQLLYLLLNFRSNCNKHLPEYFLSSRKRGPPACIL